jgi:DNA-binding XRE family transcriptional regulator
MKTKVRQPAIQWTAEEKARRKAIRDRFDNDRPPLDQLLESGEYNRPVLNGVYLALQSFLGKLQHARAQAGLSLEDVARLSGIGKSALSRLENGQQLNPTINTLGRLAAALGKGLVLETTSQSNVKAGTSKVTRPRVRKGA